MRFEAVVADIRLESRAGGRARWQMRLDPAGFRVGEWGMLEAVARSGARIEAPVLGVMEEGEEVWCVVEKPLTPGTPVVGTVGGNG